MFSIILISLIAAQFILLAGISAYFKTHIKNKEKQIHAYVNNEISGIQRQLKEVQVYVDAECKNVDERITKERSELEQIISDDRSHFFEKIFNTYQMFVRDVNAIDNKLDQVRNSVPN